MVTSDEFREITSGVYEERREKIEGDQLLYETLGLMRPGVSLYDILLTFSTEGTFGWFDLEDERQYVVLDSDELTLSHERTYVNEYINHLQAVNFDIKAKYEATEGNDDAKLALQAILEGDSGIGEYIYTTEHFTPDEQESSILQPNDAFRQALNMAPYIAIRTFVFPFAEGLDFAVQLFQAAGSWSLINQALETPPVSTEQVLHLEKYMAGELPISVEMPDLDWVIGDEWEHVRTGVLGELFIMAWLETDFSPQAAFIAAQGWGETHTRYSRGRTARASWSLQQSGTPSRTPMSSSPPFRNMVRHDPASAGWTQRSPRRPLPCLCPTGPSTLSEKGCASCRSTRRALNSLIPCAKRRPGRSNWNEAPRPLLESPAIGRCCIPRPIPFCGCVKTRFSVWYEPDRHSANDVRNTAFFTSIGQKPACPVHAQH